MALPNVNMEIQDGGLGIVADSGENAVVKLGVCTQGAPNTLYGFGSVSALTETLGAGPAVAAALATLADAGGPVYVMPVAPTAQGSVTPSSFTLGPMTVAVASAPLKELGIHIIADNNFGITDGEEGPILVTGTIADTGTPTKVMVPGTLTEVTFPIGTYAEGDSFTVTASGVAEPDEGNDKDDGVFTSPTPTTASSPLDDYALFVLITKEGARGVGEFRYSLDGGDDALDAHGGSGSYSPSILIPAGGTYFVNGMAITFTSTDDGDKFHPGVCFPFETRTAGYDSTSAVAALDALAADPTEWGCVHLVGAPSNAEGAATLASSVASKMTEMEAAYRYAFAVLECPTDYTPGSGTVDSDIKTQFADFTSPRVVVCAGDVAHVEADGSLERRNCAWVVTNRVASAPIQRDLGRVRAGTGSGPVGQVQRLYRDEAATPGLDEQGFTTMRTYIGKPGYFITQGLTMAGAGSDFRLLANRRVMDRACAVVRAAALEWINDDVRIDPATGHIDGRDAKRFEAEVGSKLSVALVDSGAASAAWVTVDRSAPLLETGTQPVTVSVVPKAYLKTISVTIGFARSSQS